MRCFIMKLCKIFPFYDFKLKELINMAVTKKLVINNSTMICRIVKFDKKINLE